MYEFNTGRRPILAPESCDGEDFMALYYCKEQNQFMDGEGEIIPCLFEIITPNDLYFFKLYKENMIVSHATIPRSFVELYYPEDEEDYVYDMNLAHDHSIVHMAGDDYERVDRAITYGRWENRNVL